MKSLFDRKFRMSEVISRLGGKVTKDEATYRPQSNTDSKECCMECEHYAEHGQPTSECRRVAGPVSAEGLCDLWVERLS